MLFHIARSIPRALTACLLTLAAGSLTTGAAQAQEAHGASSLNPIAQRALSGLFSVGGYFFTGSAHSALGSSKFYDATSFFVRPKRFGGFELTGGAQYISAKDHFFPFSGGSGFSLIGPAFKVSTPRVLGRVRPYISGGFYLGQVRSERQGFDRADFAPSIAFGAEYPFARYVTLSAGYRVNKEIHGVNTDGFSVALKVF